MVDTTRKETILTRDFLLLTLSSLLHFLASSATGPVLPRFVKLEFGHGETTVGFVAGCAALGALATRPFLSQFAARRGTRTMIITGSLLSAVGLACHSFVESVGPLYPLRIVMGMGQAAFLVGSMALAMELAPAERRGEATSLVLVGAQIGLAFGPLLGEEILGRSNYHGVWFSAAAGMVAAALVALAIQPPARTVQTAPAKSFHIAGVGPGAVLGIGQLGFIGFNTFVALYGRELGMSGVGSVFFLMSVIIVLIRFFGARLPDQLGPSVGATIALSMTALGLITVGATGTRGGLYLGTIGIGIGSAFLFTSLAAASTVGVADEDRASAIATFTIFLDLAIGLAPVVNGTIREAFDYRSMFFAAASFSLLALALMHVIVAPRLRREQATRDHAAVAAGPT